MNTVNRVVEITFVLVALFLVLSNAGAFGTVVTSIGNVYSSSVRTLQGKGY